MRYAITFTQGEEPDAHTVGALRRASSLLRALPLGALHHAVREMPSLLVEIDEDDHEGRVLALESLGLRVERDTPRAIASLFAVGPPHAEEHRWTYEPSFHPPLIVSAFAAGDVWRVRAQWAEITRDEPRRVEGVRLEAAPRIALRVGTGHAAAHIARRAFAALRATETDTEPDPHTAWTDGARVALDRPAEGARRATTAHSSEPRASGLASSGLLLASCIDDLRLDVLRAEIARYFA